MISFRIINIFLLLLVFFSFLIYFVPYGVDWERYSTQSINFSNFYFFREPIGWFMPYFFREYELGNLYVAILNGSSLIIPTYLISHHVSRSYFIAISITILLMFSNFYLLLAINGIRQGLALGFFLFAYYFAIRAKDKLSILALIIAVLSHNSVLILTPLLFIFRSSSIISLFILSTVFFSAGIISEIALKSNTEGVTNSSFAFAITLILTSAFCFVISYFKKGNDVFVLQVAYLLLMSFGYYGLGTDIFERVCYLSIPIVLILSSYYFGTIKNNLASYLILFFATIGLCYYSLNHPSVVNNFLYL